jgi:hypothetical protein
MKQAEEDGSTALYLAALNGYVKVAQNGSRLYQKTSHLDVAIQSG